MAVGIVWYFSLPYEPSLWLGSLLCVGNALIAVIFRKKSLILYPFIAFALIGFGIALSQLRTHQMDSPFLTENLSYVEVTGKIAEISPTPKGSKLILEEVTLSQHGKMMEQGEHTPKAISISLRTYDKTLLTGQIIKLRAGLFPPPEPSVPSGFDFARYFYFRSIGAVGYGIPPITASPLESSKFAVWFAESRRRLTEHIRSYFSEPAGSVAAAFITGETRTIPDEINDNMRIAGLYHLLAVSGMNLSVVAGIAFFSLRFLLALIPYLNLHYPIKKWAALLALIASYIYLRVSGSPVSAERAFFMVSLIFIAILLDRDPNPMRSVAASAFFIMLYEPESVLTASFQLSFSATAALIASYEWGINHAILAKAGAGFGIRRVVIYFAAVMMTSLVAWLGTEPFIIYHFNQFSSYSLLANTIAEPLVSFLLMPLVLAGVLLLSVGLGWLAFYPMQCGVDLLLHISGWVSHLPHAMLLVPNPTDGGFMCVVFGIIWVYFWKTRLRWLGIVIALAGMATAFSYQIPDLFISADGKHISARLENGDMVVLRGRENNFSATTWLRIGLQNEYADEEAANQHCDDKGCIFTLKGKTIAILDDAEALNDDCFSSDIVIINENVDKASCKAPLVIDKTMLQTQGAMTVSIQNGKLTTRHSLVEQGKRPWTRQ